MFDPKTLLDQFLGGQAGGNRTGGGQAGGNPLGGLLGGLAGQIGGRQQPGSGGAGGGGGMLEQAGGLLGGLNQRAAQNPLASGALAGGLAALLLGSKAGRKLGGNAVKYGGMAVIGGLAYKAYQDWQARQAGQEIQEPPQAQPELLPPPADTPFMPRPHEADARAKLLVTAMISAAKADGVIDPSEHAAIGARLDESGLDPEAREFIRAELAKPLDIDALVRQAGQPEVAAEVYAASLMAIDPDHPAEKAYLQMLAARLGLADDLVRHIEATARGVSVPA